MKITSIFTALVFMVLMFTGCSKTEITIEQPRPKLKVTINRTIVPVGAEIALTISADTAMTEDVWLRIRSHDDAIAAVAEEHLIMPKGTEKVSVDVAVVSAGETVICVEATSEAVEMAHNTVKLTAFSEPSVLKGSIEPFADASGIISNSFFLVFFEKNHRRYPACELLVHFTNWEDDSDGKTLSLHNYGGSFVGKSGNNGSVMTAVKKGANINTLKWTNNPRYNKDEWVMSMPVISSPYMESPLTGEVYIVFKSKFSFLGNGPEDSYRVWLKLNVEEVMEGNLGNCEAAVCIENEMPFKVGQME